MKTPSPRFDANVIKEAVDAHEFYLREQNLSKYGYRSRRWAEAGLCPFHEDRHAGSFKVNLDSGAFICFSCNAKGGDIIAYVIQKYHMTFLDALKMLSSEWRVL